MGLASKYIKALADGEKIHPSEILGAGVLNTLGNIYYVVPASEANYNVLKSIYSFVYNDGSQAFSATLSEAYGKTVSGRHDVVALHGNVSHPQTAMLTISKNRVHFIGLEGGGKRFGQRTRVTMGLTSDTNDIAVITNKGVGNTFSNIKFDSANSLTEALFTFAEGGEYTVFNNCEFYKSTHLDSSTAAELLMNGDSSQFNHCLFGSLANTTVGAVKRPAVILTRETITDKVCRDGVFNDCWFWTKAADVAQRLIYSTLANDVERSLTFKDCIFVAAKLGAATPDEAIGGANAQTEGYIILKDCMVVNVAKWSTLTGVYGNMPTADVSMDTVAIQAA